MADLVLHERGPLTHLAPGRHGRPDGETGVLLGQRTGHTLTLMIARKGAVAEMSRLAATVGVALPSEPKTVAADGTTVLWAGPEQWLVVGASRGRGLADRLVAACAPACMTVDQSDARAIVTIGGRRARDVLAKGFSIDLHPRVFKAGDVALTTVAGMVAQIWQVDESPHYEVAVARSYAGSFWHWLTGAAAEYGFTVGA